MAIELKLIAMAAIVIGLGAALLGYGHIRYNAGAASVQAKWDKDTGVRLEAARVEESKNREIEKQRQAAINEVTQNAQTQIDQAKADVVAATASANSMRNELTAYIARSRAASSHSAAAVASESKQNPDPVDLLADLFTRADATSGILGGYADQLKIAGTACEAAGDALK